jgi:hypothetical protein
VSLVSNVITWLELHPVTGTAILAACGFLFVGLARVLLSKKDAGPYIDPVFYSLGGKYSVVAVQEYIPSNDASGYTQIQHSRPDQWTKLITIQTSLFGMRHKVTPLDPSAHLAVLIRPGKQSNEKLILFNR